jgi:DNA helicase-4
MTRKRAKGFTICLNDNCGHMAPLCNICGADMTLRESARGAFWGCKNYRGNSGPSCSNTIDTAKITRLQAH